jgi:hypothetical protein
LLQHASVNYRYIAQACAIQVVTAQSSDVCSVSEFIILRRFRLAQSCTKHGKLKQIIKSPDLSVPEKAEVEIHEADELYKEIRIEKTS